MQHIQNDTIVPMYQTSIDCETAGQFSGKMVVSMRPLNSKDTIRSIQISSRFPAVHGAPIHLGNPEEIGIKDLMKPEYGDPPRALRSDEMPVFLGLWCYPAIYFRKIKTRFLYYS